MVSCYSRRLQLLEGGWQELRGERAAYSSRIVCELLVLDINLFKAMVERYIRVRPEIDRAIQSKTEKLNFRSQPSARPRHQDKMPVDATSTYDAVRFLNETLETRFSSSTTIPHLSIASVQIEKDQSPSSIFFDGTLLGIVQNKP